VKKSRAVVPLAFLVLLGSWVRTPLAGAARAAVQSDARPAPGAADPTDAAPQSAHDSGDAGDAIDLLGESFGLDLSTAALRQQVTAAVAVLRATDGRSAVEREHAGDILRTFAALPIRDRAGSPAWLAEGRSRIASLVGSSTPAATQQQAADAVAAFLATYFNDDALRAAHPKDDDRLLAEDFARIDKTALKLVLLRHAAAPSQTAVRFVIATLPDPIDSFTGWQFDPMLDAIAQGVAESGFVLDRFHFPDSDVESSAHDGREVTLRRVHDREPGVLVYRTHAAQYGSLIGPARLVVLIVHENPSAGVHVAALENAVKVVIRVTAEMAQIPDSEPDREIRVLGPTFSGSSDSLGRAIESFAATGVIPKYLGYRVRVLSGSATDPANKRTIERFESPLGYDCGEKAVPVRFEATVNPDDLLLAALRRHITAIGWPLPMAILYEANTQYGRQMIEMARDGNENILRLPFPLNISRLRTTRQANPPGGSDALAMPSRFRPLAMETIGNPADQIPQFSANTTAAYIEMALAETLETVRREHISTVAITATDPRDKLFLAQQIARYAPDVALVTVESDSLYAHPDYSSYLQGALVVSTYPLYNGSQRWSHGFTGRSQRRQFANGSSEGIYNATVALLNYHADGTPHGDAAPQLLDYGPPGRGCSPRCAPPIWISVVGRSSASPVATFLVDDAATRPPLNDNLAYVFGVRAQPAATAPPTGPAAFPSPLFTALVVIVTLTILVAWAAAIARGRVAPAISAFVRPDTPEAAGYLLACLGGLFVIGSYVATVAWIRVRIESQPPDIPTGDTIVSAAAFAASLLSIAALADLARRALVLVVGSSRAWRSRMDAKRLTTCVSAAVAVFAATAVGSLLTYEWQHATASVGDSVGFLTRAVDLGSGTSPTVPIVLLAAALLLWGAIELARLRRPDVALPKESVQPFVQQTINGDVKALQPGWMLFNRSMMSVPPCVLAVALTALAGVVVFAFDPFFAPLVTTEGVAYGRFVAAALIVLQLMIALALLQFLCLWAALKGLLVRMARHPLADAYDRVPRALAPVGLFPRTPALMELQEAVGRWQQTVFTARSSSTGTAGIPVEALELTQAFQDEMRKTPDIAWSKSRTWAALMDAASHTAGRLHATWRSGVRVRATVPLTAAAGVAAAVEHGAGASSALPPAAAAPDSPFGSAEHEDVIAISMAFIIRDATARLGYNLVFVIGAGLLVFCSHTLFPFQAHRRLEGLAWSYIAVAFVAIVTVLVQINRSDVVARLTSETPGARAKWDAEFVLKLVVFGLLPLLTLFAAQFPDAGATLLHWLEPVEKVLP
jgi:hypothetical protein